MAKPIMMTIDDEPQVLNAIERDLRRHYHDNYRIIKVESGEAALDTVVAIKKRNDAIALFLADQRMPSMSGTDFLAEAAKHYPQARKVLLTAYADTDAAITSINAIGLDYYLMKPWDPPDQQLYPILDDLLGDWMATVPIPYDGIRVAGTRWSPSCHNTKDFLSRNQIPYQFLDIEAEAEAMALVETVHQEELLLPVVFFPDGSHLISPDSRTLADKVGLHTRANQPFYDLIIIGAGPAGLAAAVYGASEGLRVVVVEKEATGGQAGTSARIENYLGFPQGISGGDLSRRATVQATRLGAEILAAQEAIQVHVEEPYRIVTLGDGTELRAHALLIATGMTVRKPDVQGLEGLEGASVYYGAAFTEAKYYQGGNVFVLGGANSAGQGAVFLSQYAKHVTTLVRSDSIKKSMSQYLVDQINKTQNIKVLHQTEITSLHGTDRLESITIKHIGKGTSEKVTADALFIFIGAVPHTDFVADLIERNEAGFIYTGPDLVRDRRRPKHWTLKRDPFLKETSVPGIFAAGDVCHGVVRRISEAVGQGAVAVSSIHRYLETV